MRVRISAPARLHLGDLDPFGVGRFGYASLLALNEPRTVVEASKSNEFKINAPNVEEVEAYTKKILKAYNLPGIEIKVLSQAPRHFGFGSTTQLALSIGKAVTLAYNLNIKALEILKILGRTSTGGLYVFEYGGFVVAGGLKIKVGEPIFESDKSLIPPLIFHTKFPEEWRFIIAIPLKFQSSPYGEIEDKIFQELQSKKPPLNLIYKTYFTLASKMIPAILERDSITFGNALTEIQVLVGSIYKPVQGTIFNPASQWIIPILKKCGVLGVGQSSWGPTVYGFIDDEDKALNISKKVEEKVKGRAELFIAKADNLGAKYEIIN